MAHAMHLRVHTSPLSSVLLPVYVLWFVNFEQKIVYLTVNAGSDDATSPAQVDTLAVNSLLFGVSRL